MELPFSYFRLSHLRSLKLEGDVLQKLKEKIGLLRQ